MSHQEILWSLAVKYFSLTMPFLEVTLQTWKYDLERKINLRKTQLRRIETENKEKVIKNK